MIIFIIYNWRSFVGRNFVKDFVGEILDWKIRRKSPISQNIEPAEFPWDSPDSQTPFLPKH